MDIYNAESINSHGTDYISDMYNPPSIMVLCHTSFGDSTRTLYEVGKEYKLTPTVIGPCEANDYKECIFCWVSSSYGYGCRFAIVSNIYINGKPNWTHFSDYFVCPITRDRNEKLKEIGI
jgi:hypothetical protein